MAFPKSQTNLYRVYIEQTDSLKKFATKYYPTILMGNILVLENYPAILMGNILVLKYYPAILMGNILVLENYPMISMGNIVLGAILTPCLVHCDE